MVKILRSAKLVCHNCGQSPEYIIRGPDNQDDWLWEENGVMYDHLVRHGPPVNKLCPSRIDSYGVTKAQAIEGWQTLRKKRYG